MTSQIFLPEFAMPTEINTSIPTEADLCTADTVGRYPVGTQLKGHGGLWRFSKAGAALTAARRGFVKINATLCPGSGGNSASSGFEGAFYAAVTAGDTSFKIADTAAAKNLYEGALLVIYDDTNAIYDQYRVIGNDVDDDTTTTCYIASPGFLHDVSTSSGIDVYLNPYSNIKECGEGGMAYSSAMGYAKFAVASGSYFWLQTAGVISGVTGASTWPGQTAYQRDVYANTDGSLIGITSTTYLYQRLGYLISKTAADYGDNTIMLQLDQ
jgi:hypothetical protein